MSCIRDDDPAPVVQSSIIVDVPPPEATNHGGSVSFCLLYLTFNLAAIRPMASLRHLWSNYYNPSGTFGEEGLKFVIVGLYSLVEIKSQDKTGFPFETNPCAMRVSVNCLLMYGLTSVAENVVSAAPTSLCAIVFRLGRMVSLGILVGSLASLFYF